MTELTPGVSQIINPPPPTDPAGAMQRIEQLKSDPAFQDRIKALDPGAFKEHETLWRISRGMTAEPVTPVNTTDVLTQHGERAVAAAEQHLGVYLDRGFDQEAAYQIVNRRPIGRRPIIGRYPNDGMARCFLPTK
jgi:hypothetical protein